MRPNQQNKNRSRGRNGGGGRKNVNPLSRNFESNGPDVKIRGNAAHVAERYVQLARDATATGDSVMAENYLQHAEHYFRILSAAQAQVQPRNEPVFDYDEGDSDGDDSNDNETGAQARSAAPAPAPKSDDDSEDVASGAAASDSENDDEEGRDRPRTRRPRRRRQASGEDRADPSSSPQPEVGELPAFLTGGPANAAE